MNSNQTQIKIDSRLFGYEELTNSLFNNFQNNKLHHALLFSGSKGIGKSNFAINLATQIISETNQIIDFDLNKINSFHNPNLLIIRREIGTKQELKRDITVDSIRKIRDFTNLTSGAAQNRVIIIDAADEMNRNSANALLKILEEPPANVFLFLINHNYGKLPITIKSRCNLIKIKAPDFNNFKKALNQIDFEIDNQNLKNLFTISQGSIATALEFHNHDAIKLYEEILKINPKQFGSQINSIIAKINDKDFSWMVFERLIIFYLNRLFKTISKVPIDDYILEDEAMNLVTQSKNKSTNIFDINDKITKILSETSHLNLDKKQSIINIFNLIYGL